VPGFIVDTVVNLGLAIVGLALLRALSMVPIERRQAA
jgi:hypothetical protein